MFEKQNYVKYSTTDACKNNLIETTIIKCFPETYYY